MTNSEAIIKITKYLDYNFHFTDYEFGGMNEFTGEKAPRPEKTEWLTNQFKDLMNKLCDFLKTDPNKKSLSNFIVSELETINSKDYLKDEYRMLICKYDQIPRWCLGCTAALDYFKSNESKLKYYT